MTMALLVEGGGTHCTTRRLIVHVRHNSRDSRCALVYALVYTSPLLDHPHNNSPPRTQVVMPQRGGCQRVKHAR